MTFSNKTIALLTRALQSFTSTHNDIDLLIMEYGFLDTISASTVNSKCFEFVQMLKTQAETCSDSSQLLEVIERILVENSGKKTAIGHLPDLLKRLVNSLKIDGFEFLGIKLLPTTPSPSALASELSKLEIDLNNFGFHEISNHYNQAHENFTLGNVESCNGQIRSFVEGLFLQLGKIKSEKDLKNPGHALQNLKDNKFLDGSEFQTFKGFWDSIQDAGPHFGLSSEQEALYRLHSSTAIGRYLLHKLQSEH